MPAVSVEPGEDPTTALAAEAEAVLARAQAAFPKSGHLMPAFLQAYEETENQSIAGKRVNVGHDAIAAWKKNKDFMVLFTAAHLRGAARHNDDLRTSAIQRGIRGTPKYATKNGQLVLDEKTKKPIIIGWDHETNLTIFLLKNRMPGEFSDRIQHDINVEIINILTGEIGAIIRRKVPDFCPHCKTALNLTPAIVEEMQTLASRIPERASQSR